MTSTFTIFEHEYTTGFNWTDTEAAALERINKAFGTEVLRATVRAGKHELRAAQHVGIVRVGGRTIQVLPKIHRTGSSTDEERAIDATRNLLYMLAYAGQLPVREHALASLLRRGADWFEILTRIFATHLLEEWQHGAYRNYQSLNDESPVLKGKWRISHQLRNPARGHIFSVTYDEFTDDNELNRIFRFVVERLWKLTRDGDNRQTLGELRQWMEGITLLPRVTSMQATPALLTRLNARFAPLLNLARLFLDEGAIQLASGDLSTFAFVFDMNALFESFLIEFIRRHREEILPSALCSCELLPQSYGAAHFLAKRDGSAVFMLKPDLVFRHNNRFPLLMDTKYKRLDKADSKLGVSQGDFYQMHAYAHRYECAWVLLLYPQTTEMAQPLRARFIVERTNIAVTAATVNLQVALDTRHGRGCLIDELRELFAGEGEDGES